MCDCRGRGDESEEGIIVKLMHALPSMAEQHHSTNIVALQYNVALIEIAVVCVCACAGEPLPCVCHLLQELSAELSSSHKAAGPQHRSQCGVFVQRQ